MKRKAVIAIAAVVAIVLLALGAWAFLNRPAPSATNPEKVTIGVPMMLDSSALVYIADDRHFFTDNGLNVTIRVYDAGLYAVDDMLAGKNDIAIATEFVMVGKALQQKNITGFGSISRYQIHYLIGRNDHGIAGISDLKGKKVGFAFGTSGEFYLSRFLELHGINPSEITPVDIKPSQYADAIVNGSVDAVLAWDPYADKIKDSLGDNIVSWPAQSGQQGYWNLICRDDWAAQHPETMRRFLRAIDQSATYRIYHPDEALAIVKQRSGLDDVYISTTMANTEYGLSLDQSLITAMEDEGRWMVRNNLTTAQKIPDFQDYIYAGSMKAVKPEAVNIILSGN